MPQAPWADHLARAAQPNAAPNPQSARAPAASSSPTGTPDRARLQQLMGERAALEQRMQHLTQGSGPALTDPRYQVASMAQRRAEYASWTQRRDQGGAKNPRDATAIGSAAPAMRPTAAERTPGERPTNPAAVPGATGLADINREPATPYDRDRDMNAVLDDRLSRVLDRLRGDAHAAASEDTLYALLDERRGAALSRAQERMDATRHDLLRGAQHGIAQRWDALGDDLFTPGRPDPYSRALVTKLGVDVGSLDDLGDRLDRLRAVSSERRMQALADEQRDQQRRDRALEQARARREEEAAHG